MGESVGKEMTSRAEFQRLGGEVAKPASATVSTAALVFGLLGFIIGTVALGFGAYAYSRTLLPAVSACTCNNSATDTSIESVNASVIVLQATTSDLDERITGVEEDLASLRLQINGFNALVPTHSGDAGWMALSTWEVGVRCFLTLVGPPLCSFFVANVGSITLVTGANNTGQLVALIPSGFRPLTLPFQSVVTCRTSLGVILTARLIVQLNGDLQVSFLDTAAASIGVSASLSAAYNGMVIPHYGCGIGAVYPQY